MKGVKTLILVTFWVVNIYGVYAQEAQETLFSVDDTNVTVAEFLSVFQKSHYDDKVQTRRDLEEYLDLYINYKLKLKDAYAKGLDQTQKYNTEYTRYKNQLLKPYLKDTEAEEAMVMEAYQRMKEEVKASHILIKLPKYPTAEDTLKAYQKIKEIKQKIDEGEDFKQLAVAYSEDPSAKQNGGELGYFSVFKMVYPFETAAYNTPVGQVSDPVRTQFGYHLIKVEDKRPAKGEVEVAHIMLKGDFDKNESLINDLKRRIDQGEDFYKLATENSQDQGTVSNGGRLPRFGVGRMVEPFENVAFSLINDGDVSEPFKTHFGWHIVKLIHKYPIPTLEEKRAEIEESIRRDSRSHQLEKGFVERLMKNYRYEIDYRLLNAFVKDNWQDNIKEQDNRMLFSIDDRQYSVNDFYEFFKVQKQMNYKVAFEKFKEQKTIEYYLENLPKMDAELSQTLRSFREGILIFDQMQENVWEKAQKDTLGLQNYYNTHRDLYVLPQSTTLIMVSFRGDETLILEQLKRAAATEDFTELIDNEQIVGVRDRRINGDRTGLPSQLRLIEGQYVITQRDYFKEIYYINDVEPAEYVPLEKIKGKVITDYQNVLENKWIKELKQTYPVTVNTVVFNELKSKFKY